MPISVGLLNFCRREPISRRVPALVFSLILLSASPMRDPLIDARQSTAKAEYDDALVQLDAAEKLAEDPHDQAEIKHLRGIAHAAKGDRISAILSFVLASRIDPAAQHPAPEPFAPLADCGRALAISGLDAPGIESRVRSELARDDWVCPVIVVGGTQGPQPGGTPKDEIAAAALVAAPTPPAVHAWRWSWIGAGVAAFGAGLAMELTRDTTDRGLGAADFVGPGMMVAGAGSVLVGWLSNPFEPDGE